MADRPILFSAPMVRALLDGRKTQTRRALKLRRFGKVTEFGPSDTPGYTWHFRDVEKRWHDLRDADLKKFLYFAVGDRLWVRETFSFIGGDGVFDLSQARTTGRYQPLYRADVGTTADRWWPAIHMPREFSRLALAVTDVRVQRLQEINEADCVAEGAFVAEPRPHDCGQIFVRRDPKETWHSMTPKAWYHELWDTINGAGAWDANPWIVALTFTVERRNIDGMPVVA